MRGGDREDLRLRGIQQFPRRDLCECKSISVLKIVARQTCSDDTTNAARASQIGCSKTTQEHSRNHLSMSVLETAV